MKQINLCQRCGGELHIHNDKYECSYCGAIFEEEKVVDFKEELNILLDELKQERVANLRTMLWDATHEKYQSKDKINKIAHDIRSYLPDDFLACFYEVINTQSNEEINEYLNSIDVKKNYHLMDLVIDYIIKTMDVGNILVVNNLIENTYKQKDLKLYNDYCTKLSSEAEKLESGIYELSLSRDVFIAYSSKDMKYVSDLTSKLEENGISCFVALRNLRHGKGAVENYDKALEQAINNSHIFLFVSSTNSRSLACDALKKEIPYVKKRDLELAPAEYRHAYNKLPAKFKKPRVELLVGGTPKGTPADKMVSEFFDGFEWRYDVDSTVETIFNILTTPVEEDETEKLKRELEELKKSQQALLKAEKEKQEKEKLQKELEELKKKQDEEEKDRLRKELEEQKKKQQETEERLRKEKELKSKKEEKIETNKQVTSNLKKEESKPLYRREGNDIYFGSYFSVDNKNKEPLKWNILKEENGKAFIISDKIIAAKAFDTSSNSYERSDVRKWLNNDFYQAAFTKMDQSIIQDTQVDGVLNDKVFLLSLDEAKTYYEKKDDRQAIATEYARKFGAYRWDNGKTQWLLRSPVKSDPTQVYYISYTGGTPYGLIKRIDGIRPALWIDLYSNLSAEEKAKELQKIEEEKKAKELAEKALEENKKIYNNALELKLANEYDKAIELFKQIIDFNDSRKQIEDCKNERKAYIYKKAVELKHKDHLFEAISLYKEVIDYKDAAEQVESCSKRLESIYQEALRLIKYEDYSLAKTRFSKMLGYKDAKDKYDLCESELKKQKDETEALKKSFKRVGNNVLFGFYCQKDGKTKEPIKWNILKEENGKALIITDKIIDVVKFADKSNNYEDSYIRNWLNNDFYNNAFNDELKGFIETTIVDNSLKSTMDKKNKYICDNTIDKIFLLSIVEVNTYYKNDKEKQASGTEYAKANGLWVDSIYGNSCWWLRSPLYNYAKGVSKVAHDGTSLGYEDVYHTTYGVRPALWINLSNKKDTKLEAEIKLEEERLRKVKEDALKPYKREGDDIIFGSYFQSSAKTKRPLTWNILKEENGKALIISDKIIDCVKFDDKSNNYEKSYVRKWLNNDFYNNAFDEKEKSIIDTTLVDNSLKSTMDKVNQYVCNNTNDKIFLLSTEEANIYYKKDNKRRAQGTEYAKNNGLRVSNGYYAGTKGNSDWWLRSPYYKDYASAFSFFSESKKDIGLSCCVADNGRISFSSVNSSINGVRPALWINL